mmetsp:Transcript_18012/g.50045  ORF Transcript_18012/g.50045 Transcript_18012/m.50045 type:complete len:92 (+) Transcript_18012:1018-1293(+)
MPNPTSDAAAPGSGAEVAGPTGARRPVLVEAVAFDTTGATKALEAQRAAVPRTAPFAIVEAAGAMVDPERTAQVELDGWGSQGRAMTKSQP